MCEVIKSYESQELTEAQMEAINRHTRRPLAREEVYVFAVNLCDNEVDRDGERFTEGALSRLAELFVGRTGIFDHDPRGRNQTARIFSAEVRTVPGRLNRLGKPYQVLRALAYMVRSEKNEDLILEIDGGIKKEVSVSCAVAHRRCSVCGAEGSCEHRPGQTYDGVLCCTELEDPTDAYEWSFVAVPAQPGAGVTKSFGSGERTPALAEDCPVEEILKGLGEGHSLSAGQARRLTARMEELKALAEAGARYRDALQKDFVRLSCALCPELSGEMAERIAKRMAPEELEHCRSALRRKTGELYPARPQLSGPDEESTVQNRSFRL